jgi:hypothetical protein
VTALPCGRAPGESCADACCLERLAEDEPRAFACVQGWIAPLFPGKDLPPERQSYQRKMRLARSAKNARLHLLLGG